MAWITPEYQTYPPWKQICPGWRRKIITKNGRIMKRLSKRIKGSFINKNGELTSRIRKFNRRWKTKRLTLQK